MKTIATFSEIWVPGNRKLNFDPSSLAETTRTMSDEQYYVLKNIVGDNQGRQPLAFAEVCSQYQQHVADKQAAEENQRRQFEAAQQKEMITGIVNEVLSEILKPKEGE